MQTNADYWYYFADLLFLEAQNLYVVEEDERGDEVWDAYQRATDIADVCAGISRWDHDQNGELCVRAMYDHYGNRWDRSPL